MAKMKTSTSAGSKQRSAKDASFAPVSNAETTNNSKCSSSFPSATKGIVYVFNEAKAGGESVKETGTAPSYTTTNRKTAQHVLVQSKLRSCNTVRSIVVP
ncbi:hypothetical protein PPTG_25027 [Phytophthora nicotianae INRA-310]|uniref:Uncharacterized protein n=1 Tax=Phytophthora nicotianae (strain INRA-310) TaxID=761204 RepID=W2PAJ3_PHYN3|nr:hypothetical protein PPTG_25027 [Phytophthora nicotianae INRA-310]ETM97253.1 hypothetical protein PPTG_25027 [Phytophthora nicotianae INRA-310]